MGYNYTLTSSAGSEILLCPNDSDETYPIETPDIAEMIELYFYDNDISFTADDLIEVLKLFDYQKGWTELGTSGDCDD